MAEQETVTHAETPIVKKRVVLIAVDGSDHSERAFTNYMKDIHKDGDFLIVLNVQEMPVMPITPYPYPIGKKDYLEEYNENLAKSNEKSKEYLKMYGRKLKEMNVHEKTFQLIKEPGRPEEVIIHNAKEEGADLIVMGSRGLGVIRRTILGSVSQYVVHHSHLPVFIVR